MKLLQLARVFVVSALLLLLVTEVEAQRVTIRDVSGRTVTLDQPARRILIDDGRFLAAMALIHPDPVSLLAGWPRDVHRLGERTYQSYVAKFPRLPSVPQVSSSAGEFSLEMALAARPDVAVVSLGQGPNAAQVQQLERAGVKVVFIDFFTQPFENLEPSLQILGALTGRTAQARAFLDFRRSHMNLIAERVRTRSGARPTVFLETHAGISADCCNSAGKGNVGDYIDFVGGHNIAADVLPGVTGRLNLEYVIASNPAVYIATGGPHLSTLR